jgi:FecR protein
LTVKNNDEIILRYSISSKREAPRMVRWRRSGLAWLVLAIYLLPAPALAQSTKAGVVTTLEGNVTAVRAVAPQPVALKFKDDVFLQDRVVTGEQAFARLLLGGKAVISIRERSAVTITEVPGRSTVEIESGKIALSVARERMLPGEVINIKTPNAIAGVRGTVVVAQVTYRQGQPFTNLWVLRGTIDAIHTNVTGAPLSQPVPVGEKESFNADQATATKGAFTLEEVGTIVQGLQPQRTQDVGSASQSPARLEAVNTAVALLGALVGSGGQQQMALLTGPPPPIPAPATTPEQTVTEAPLTPLSNPEIEQALSECSQGGAAACAALGQSAPTGQSPPTEQPPPADTPDVIINDTTVALGAADTLKTFTGTSTRPGTSPLIRITDSTVNGPASTLVTALPDANATLQGGPLMKVTDSILDVLRLLHVQGSLTSLSAAPLIAFDPVTVNAQTLVEIAAGGSLSLAGPLLTDLNGVIATTQDAISVSGTLTSTGPGALVALQGTNLAVGALLRLAGAANLTLHGSLVFAKDTSFTATDVNRGAFALTDGASLTTTGTAAPLFSFVSSNGESSQVTTARQLLTLTGTPASSMTLSGPLLSANRTTIHTGNPTANTFGLIFAGDSATLTSSTTLPLLSFVDATVDLAGTVLSARRSTSIAAPTSVTLGGPLMFASGSTITTTSSGFDAFFGTTGVACCPVVSLHQGARLTTTQDLPLIQLSNATVNVGPDARSGSSLFLLADALNGAPAGELVAPSTAALAGQLLTATNSTISTLFHLMQVTNSTLSSTTPSALVSLSDGGALTLGGSNPLASGAETFARLLSLSGAGASISLRGPLFDFSGLNVSSTGEMLGVFNSSSLTSTTIQPLIQLSGGTFTTGATSNFMSIASSAGLSPSMQLAGPLLSATNATLRNGDPTISTPQTTTLRAFTFIGDSAQVRSTSTEPLFDFNAATVDTSASVMSVRRSLSTATPTRLTLDGPLFRATNNSTINVTSLALGTACCSAFDVEQAAQLVSSTTFALIQLASSVLNAGPDGQSGGTLFFVADAGGVADGPVTASPALVSLHGPLISSLNGNLSSLFHLIGVTRSTLMSTSPDALIQLNGSLEGDSALRLGGIDPFIAPPNNQTRTGRVLSVVSSATAGTAGATARVSLAGPLLDAKLAASIQLTGDIIGVFNGASVDSTSTLPFMRLNGNGTILVAGATDPGSGAVVDGRLAFVSGIGGSDGLTPATLTLSGPVLRAENGSVIDTNSKGLSLFTNGALVARAPPSGTYPLLTVDASSLSVGGPSRSGRLFEVTGFASPTTLTAPPLVPDPDPNPVTGQPSGLQFGQQRPLQHNGGGPLLEASNGAFVDVRGANGNVLRLDTALLDATAPLIALTGNGTLLQASGNGIDLANNARLQSTNAPEGLIRLENQARMDVLTGHLVNVSASRLNVAGDLVRMGNNTVMNVGSQVFSGVLLNVLNGGIVNINGALVRFTGINAAINVTNTLAPTSFIAGIPVSFAQGANVANVSIGAGALAGLNTNGNIIRINGTQLPSGATLASGITGSLINVGANGTVRIAGTPN